MRRSKRPEPTAPDRMSGKQSGRHSVRRSDRHTDVLTEGRTAKKERERDRYKEIMRGREPEKRVYGRNTAGTVRCWSIQQLMLSRVIRYVGANCSLAPLFAHFLCFLTMFLDSTRSFIYSFVSSSVCSFIYSFARSINRWRARRSFPGGESGSLSRLPIILERLCSDWDDKLFRETFEPRFVRKVSREPADEIHK